MYMVHCHCSFQNGVTPLIAASFSGHVDTIRALIEAKADINQTDEVMSMGYKLYNTLSLVVLTFYRIVFFYLFAHPTSHSHRAVPSFFYQGGQGSLLITHKKVFMII